MFNRFLGALGWVVDPIPNPQPVPSDSKPMSEARVGQAGGASPYARGDHMHERLTSATVVTLDANGDATVTFTRSFESAPIVTYSYEEAAAGQPVIIKRVTWIKDGALFTGMTIHGYRLQRLPAVIALLSGLINYDIAGGSASGVVVDVIALKTSTT